MFLRILAALLLILSASPALAQADDDLPGPRECLDDDHTNRCDPEVQARVRERLGVASIEDEAASGAIVYRAFFVNGYGNDMPAVSFERRPGQSPEVVIYGFEGRSTRAPVSQEAWDDVVSQGRIADRTIEPLAPTPGTDPDEVAVSICMHPWVQTIEMANVPRERFSEDPVRRRTESSCGGGLTTRFAYWLAGLAVEQIPWCRLLNDESQRNAVTLAVTCLMLEGDRITAAEVYNDRLSDGPWEQDEDLSISEWRQRLGFQGSPTLRWGDQTIRSTSWRNQELLDFLFARFADHPHLRFWPTQIEGVDTRHVLVRGIAEATTAEDVRLTADYTQTWSWREGILQWSLDEWTVGPFAPASTDD